MPGAEFATYMNFKLHRIKSGIRKNISKIASSYQCFIVVKGTATISSHGRNAIMLAHGTRINCSVLRLHTHWLTAVSDVDLFWLGPIRL